MKDLIEVKVAGKRRTLRICDILQVEEGQSGNALLHLDSWTDEPLETEETYDQVTGQLKALQDA